MSDQGRRFLLGDQKFTEDWLRQWVLYGSVYAINRPEPHIVPMTEIEIRKRGETWPDSLDAAWAEAKWVAHHQGYTLTLEARPDGWVEATATSDDDKHEITDAEHTAGPAAALRGLTARLHASQR